MFSSSRVGRWCPHRPTDLLYLMVVIDGEQLTSPRSLKPRLGVSPLSFSSFELSVSTYLISNINNVQRPVEAEAFQCPLNDWRWIDRRSGPSDIMLPLRL